MSGVRMKGALVRAWFRHADGRVFTREETGKTTWQIVCRRGRRVLWRLCFPSGRLRVPPRSGNRGNAQLLDLLVALAIGAIVMVGIWGWMTFSGAELGRAWKQAEIQRTADLVAQVLKRETDASVRLGTADCGANRGQGIRLHRVEVLFSASPVTMREEFRCIYNAEDNLWRCQLAAYDDTACADDPVPLAPLPIGVRIAAEFVAEVAVVPQYTPVSARVTVRREGFGPYTLPLLLTNKGHLP